MPAGLEIALVAAAVLIGATGTWSPCGLSMIETIGPTGHTGGRIVTLAACATFLPGALAGGLLTFGGLALVGSAIPGSGTAVYVLAATVALIAALAELRGARIAPQVRRQLPEHWRRVMPMPVAAALYGVLLGLGFTTFVLTFGVWALAGISLALGDPYAGLLVGLGFGVGRALPIVALAPIADRAAGRTAVGMMGERPGLYRGIRVGDGVALIAAAVALLAASAAEAGTTKALPRGADPSVNGGKFASQRADRTGELRAGGAAPVVLPGTDPAVGGAWVAVIDGPDVALLDQETLQEVSRAPAPRADALAVSQGWLAYRSRIKGRDRITTRHVGDNGGLGDPTTRVGTGRGSQLSRPSLDGSRLAYARASSRLNRVVIDQLGKKKARRVPVSSALVGISNPSLLGKALLYVRSTRRGDELRLHTNGSRGSGRLLLRASRGRLWTTALSGKRAYVTRFKSKRAGTRTRIVSVSRK